MLIKLWTKNNTYIVFGDLLAKANSLVLLRPYFFLTLGLRIFFKILRSEEGKK